MQLSTLSSQLKTERKQTNSVPLSVLSIFPILMYILPSRMSICMLCVVSIAMRYPILSREGTQLQENITDAMPPKIHRQRLRDMNE